MTSTLLRRLGPLLLGGSCCARPDRDREFRRTAHRLSRADHRHLRPGRQGHGRRLQDVSRREQQQARRRRREVHRRGRAGQAGHRRHQGQEAHPAGQGALLRRRPAGVDRLRAGAGEHRREGALRLPGRRGRRPDPARPCRNIRTSSAPAGRSSQPSHPFGQWACDQGYKKIVAIGADYAFGYEVVGGFQRAFEACGGQIIQKIWPPLGTKDFGPYIPTLKADADAIFIADGRPDVAAIPQAARGVRQQEAGDRRRHEL